MNKYRGTIAAAAFSLSSCATIISVGVSNPLDENAQIYGGTKINLSIINNCLSPDDSVYKKDCLMGGVLVPFSAIDFIPSLLLDTLLLPITFTSSVIGKNNKIHKLCKAENLTLVKRLDELPENIAKAIGKDRIGHNGIADRGKSFSNNFAIRNDLPKNRFHLAAVSDACAIVAIERGGSSYKIEIQTYTAAKMSAWQLTYTSQAKKLPESIDELLTQ